MTVKKIKETLLGRDFRKIQPKLRMIANGSQQVNEVRSDISSALRVAKKIDLSFVSPFKDLEASVVKRPPKKGRLRKVTGDIEASVFIQRTDSADSTNSNTASRSPLPLENETFIKGNQSTAEIRLDQLSDIAKDPSVTYIEMGEPLEAPAPVVNAGNVGAPAISRRRFNASGGQDVLIGIIDVQGFDFAHSDFLKNNDAETRFYKIWDQGGESRPSPAKFNYGAEITKQHMDQAITHSSSGASNLAPQVLEPQSQMVNGSHGTHVSSIAAGNRGICRNAPIVGVLISLPEEDEERRRSFYDSTRIAHAVEYILDTAQELNLPVSINISLGTNGHAHDASSAVSRWCDSALAVPGRSICIAAGNAGQEAPESEDDYGFIMGRIHTSGRINAMGLENDIEWTVVGNSIQDVSENELEIWYSPADRFAVSIRPPGQGWIGPIEPRQFIENRQLSDRSFLSVYNELYHPANGANYIGIYLSPYFGQEMVKGVAAGIWTIRLHGREIRDGRYHGWIERDDPRPVGQIGLQEYWQFPSFFTTNSNVDNSSISSMACGHRIVAVANLDEEKEKISITSSQGPTRDGRFKPDVSAPGTDIVAANGFEPDENDTWIAMSGTSMASPYVAGIVGLMLEKEPNLTAAQIGGIIQRTARPLPGTDYTWRNDAGFGMIDHSACLEEAEKINQREDLT
jgi:subtilisin family serine protease